MVMAPDASTIMGETQIDTVALGDLAKGDYSRNVRENLPRDYVQMYHPDGTTSIVQLPPLGKNGKGLKDRQQKLMHYVLNKKAPMKQADGTIKMVQWWYPSPPSGWQTAPLPWRCPVQGCMRAGGLPDLLNLYRHIHQKHPGEKDLYDGVIKAIKQKLAEAIPADLATLLNETGEKAPVVSPAEIAAAKFDDAAAIMDEELPSAGIEPGTFGIPYACTDCDWTPKPNATSPRTALLMHRSHKHKEA